MTRNTLTNWWGAVTTVFGVAVLTLGVAGMLFGEAGEGGAVLAAASSISGGLILGGLLLMRQHVITGSRMIVAGAALTIPSIFLIPVATLIVIGGLWTGHLQLRSNMDEPHLQPHRPLPTDLTTRWYLWLVAALILFAVGLGALAVLGDGQTPSGEDDTSLLGGLAYLAWVFSWLAAVISTGMGIVFGTKRGLTRHRTRPA